jgi:2'-5' RNA ligase
MRLFIAINFSDGIKSCLEQANLHLATYALKGNFTKRENFHQTLVFIGEVGQADVDNIKEVMDGLDAPVFHLTINGVGKFTRNSGDIYWLGIDESKQMMAIYDYLSGGLIRAGFPIDKRPFKPHLTLAREAVMADRFNEEAKAEIMPKMTIRIKTISLMESKRIGGKLVYDEIYSVKLKNDVKLDDAFKPGRYRHFKGKEYRLLYLANHSETEEPMVVYQALYGDYGIWVRPAKMWNNLMEHNGKQVPRFKYIGKF